MAIEVLSRDNLDELIQHGFSASELRHLAGKFVRFFGKFGKMPAQYYLAKIIMVHPVNDYQINVSHGISTANIAVDLEVIVDDMSCHVDKTNLDSLSNSRPGENEYIPWLSRPVTPESRFPFFQPEIDPKSVMATLATYWGDHIPTNEICLK